MRSPAAPLILGTLPAIVAGAFVRWIADVTRTVWMVQGVSVMLSVARAWGHSLLAGVGVLGAALAFGGLTGRRLMAIDAALAPCSASGCWPAPTR